MASENEETVHQRCTCRCHRESERCDGCCDGGESSKPAAGDDGDVRTLGEAFDRIRRVCADREDFASVDVVVGEVRRLREEVREANELRELAVKRGDQWEQQWEEMRDTMWKPAMDKLARVEALPAKWRETKTSAGCWDVSQRDAYIEELEAALKGES